MTIPERYLGDTRSKKKICCYDTDDVQYLCARTIDYDVHDRFDGLCLFEFKSLEAIRLYGAYSDEYHTMDTMHGFFRSYFDSETLTQEMASLGLITSIDRGIYGKSLIKHFLHK